jgi:hypothetical protein
MATELKLLVGESIWDQAEKHTLFYLKKKKELQQRALTTSVKSRTEYVISSKVVRLYGILKIQGDVATSTMESEYNALSMSM